MKLEIRVMFPEGKTFLVDQETNIEYYMNEIGGQIRKTEPLDSHPMNLQGTRLINSQLYEGKIFQTLEDAQQFINRVTIKDNIDSLRKSKIQSDKKDALIRLYQEELERYQ